MERCRRITQLVSDGLDRRLTFGERLRVRFHLAICSACANFEKQMQYIRGYSRAFLERMSSDRDN